jgi:hypothetical protein
LGCDRRRCEHHHQPLRLTSQEITLTTINPVADMLGHDGVCDTDSCDQPVTVCKLAAAPPAGDGGLGWSESAPPASISLHCSQQHADLQPTAQLHIADQIAAHITTLHGGPGGYLWRELLASYPATRQLDDLWGSR